MYACVALASLAIADVGPSASASAAVVTARLRIIAASYRALERDSLATEHAARWPDRRGEWDPGRPDPGRRDGEDQLLLLVPTPEGEQRSCVITLDMDGKEGPPVRVRSWAWPSRPFESEGVHDP